MTYWLSSHDRTGVYVVWKKTDQRLEFGGWYDSFVAIEEQSMTLHEFFDQLQITEEDCKKAWDQSQRGKAE